ncbi:MAG: hypothetical protein SNG35_06565 [Rikenellaceae bacterium]
MGRLYKIKCRDCGTQFIHSAESSYGMVVSCVGCGDQSPRQGVIRCPGCQRVVNTTDNELRDQIVEESIWD